jgi:xylulokinase
MNTALGIDIGTSGTKVALFDEEGTLLVSHTQEYPLYQPENGWAEQDPHDWWSAVCTGCREVMSSVGKNHEVCGIGLSGQMHGLVMLGGSGEVLRSSIIWADQRTGRQAEEMNALIGEKRLIEITANPAMTGFTAAKILWVKENQPEVYARCAHILLPKDYIRYMLTGELATEVSDASGMQLMDVQARGWSQEVLDALGISRNLLADMYESPDVTGRVSAVASKQTLIPAGVPVAGGAGDNAAAAIGTGVVREGSAFTTIGSSAVVYAVSDKLKLDLDGRVHSLCASVPGKWTVMSCTQGAGLSLKWLREQVFALKAGEVPTYADMDKMAMRVPPGAERLLFLPYLMGERSPHPDPDCRGVFFGLSAMHTRAHLVRAVLEGVAFSQLECVEVFRQMGVQVSDMAITGSGAKSPFWSQMLADLYGCPISKPYSGEGAALGAALLAFTAAGVYGSVEEAADKTVKREAAIIPSLEAREALLPYYYLYTNLYKTMKNDFKRLASL